MKVLIGAILVLVTLVYLDAPAEVVRNRLYQQESVDSVMFRCTPIDSSGQPVALASGDTVIVNVFYPNGDSCFAELLSFNDAKIVSQKATVSSRDRFRYNYISPVSDVDGDGRRGVYRWTVTVWDTSLALETPYGGTFTPSESWSEDRLDSTTAYLRAENAHRIADDRGRVLVYDTATWWMRTALVGDSITTTGDVLYGRHSITIWCSDNDSTVALVRIDTNEVDTRSFSTFTFWAQIEGDHPHEGVTGDQAGGQNQDSATALGALTLFLSEENDSSAITKYFYYDFTDVQLMRGWNKLIIHRDEMSSQGSPSWDNPMLWVGFMIDGDSAGANIWATIDDLRFNKRSEPVFMLRMDDSDRSQLTHAFPVLDDFGYDISIFVNGFRVLGSDTGVGNNFLSLGDLAFLDVEGWDICNHGWDAAEGESSDTLIMAGPSRRNDRYQINKNQEWLLDNGSIRGAGFFTWPYDAYDTTAIDVLMERHDFGSGGKNSEVHDHLMQEEPPGTELRRFIYPFTPYTAVIHFDTVKAWIDRAIKRGNPLIINMHSFTDSYHDTLPMNIDDTPEEFTRQSDPDSASNSWQEVNELTPNDNDGLELTDGNGTDPTTTMIGFTDADSTTAIFDSLIVTFRLRANAAFTAAQLETVDSQKVYLLIDTGNGDQTIATFEGTGDTLNVAATNYTYTFTDITNAKLDAAEFGIRVDDGGGQFAGTLECLWIFPELSKDNSNTVQTDSTVLRAMCNYLESKGHGFIPMSDYFLTGGAGGRLTKILNQTQETRDTILTLDADLQTLVDSLQAVLDTLQNQDDWVATLANQTLIIDSLQATIDTLQNQDNWVAKEASLLATTDLDAALGRFIDTLAIDRGTATGASSNSITLAASATATTDLYNGLMVTVYAGTGLGQSRLITSYTSGRVATVSPNWTVNPTNGVYVVWSFAAANVAMWQAIPVTTSDMAPVSATDAYTAIVDEWELQANADPTGFKVNVLEWLGAGVGAAVGGVPNVNATTIADRAIASATFAVDAQYANYGGGVWIDSLNGALGTTVGVNGIPTNPCRNFIDGKVIADSIGAKTFFIEGGGTTLIEGTMEGYIFIGLGDEFQNTVDFGSQDLDGSEFIFLSITGTQGGTSRIGLSHCDIVGGVSLHVEAVNCGLSANITVTNNDDNLFIDCVSDVAGGGSPEISMSGAVGDVEMLGHKGPVTIKDMGAAQVFRFVGDGTLTIDASCHANATIDVHGMVHIVNNSSATPEYVATAQNILDEVRTIYTFLGACDGCWYQLFPPDGSANKDSLYVWNPALGADSLDGRIVYYHSNDAAVYDSARFDRGPAPFPAP